MYFILEKEKSHSLQVIFDFNINFDFICSIYKIVTYYIQDITLFYLNTEQNKFHLGTSKHYFCYVLKRQDFYFIYLLFSHFDTARYSHTRSQARYMFNLLVE